jgi:Flp pilus assembly protein TadB
MHTVASFHASAVQPDQLSEIMAAHLALEHARIFRRLLVKRFGVLAVIAAGVSFLWLSVFAFWFSVALCVVVPAWAWMVELRYERRLARRLDAVPGQAMHPVESTYETGS